jgi:hypothetical protein
MRYPVPGDLGRYGCLRLQRPLCEHRLTALGPRREIFQTVALGNRPLTCTFIIVIQPLPRVARSPLYLNLGCESRLNALPLTEPPAHAGRPGQAGEDPVAGRRERYPRIDPGVSREPSPAVPRMFGGLGGNHATYPGEA